MGKYQLGVLTVCDNGLQDTKQEIVGELIDRMQKYVVEGDTAYKNPDLTSEEKLAWIERICNHFIGLAEFLQIAMGVDVRRSDGFSYIQEMYNRFFYWKQALGRR